MGVAYFDPFIQGKSWVYRIQLPHPSLKGSMEISMTLGSQVSFIFLLLLFSLRRLFTSEGTTGLEYILFVYDCLK